MDKNLTSTPGGCPGLIYYALSGLIKNFLDDDAYSREELIQGIQESCEGIGFDEDGNELVPWSQSEIDCVATAGRDEHIFACFDYN